MVCLGASCLWNPADFVQATILYVDISLRGAQRGLVLKVGCWNILSLDWAAVKELELSYHIPNTTLIPISPLYMVT